MACRSQSHARKPRVTPRHEILDNFDFEIRRLMLDINSDVELVHLYANPVFGTRFQEVAAKSSRSLARFVPRHGRSAYLLSGKGASKLCAMYRVLYDHGDKMLSRLAARGHIEMMCATRRFVDNFGQLRFDYAGELFPSNVHTQG